LNPLVTVLQAASLVVAALLLLWLVANLVAAYLAARGASPPSLDRTPARVALAYDDIEYAPGLPGWYVAADDRVASVVVVHAFGANRIGSRGEQLGLAHALHHAGFGVLLIDLGFATKAHPYSGGELEAEEVREAITWLGRRTEGAVAVIGVSEGAMATLAAARSGVPIAAFVADSAFLDGRAVLARGFSSSLHLPRFLFRLVPQLFPLWSGGHRPLNLSAEDLQSWHTPTLVIQGENDRVVPPAVGRRLAELTKGQLWTVADASHAGALGQDADRYVRRVIEFLAGARAAWAR
jgi:pimeloyl-ACP methyl ester carboxylesterase